MYTREDSWFKNYNNTLKSVDTNYLTDLDKMDTLGIENINESYWLASRNVNIDSIESVSFRVRNVYDTGYFSYRHLCDVINTGTVYSYSHTYGLRPVFTLKTGIKVIGGNGEETSPYTLGT